MFTINKLVGLLTSPAVIGMGLLWLGLLVTIAGRRKFAGWMAGVTLAWFMFWTSPATYRCLATGMERDFPLIRAENQPPADAIVILGGGMACNTNVSVYSEMWFSADRAWHGARLFKAGKSTNVFVTANADVQLLTDLGVPRSAINSESLARNTEEEAKFVDDFFSRMSTPDFSSNFKPKVLLVTSAWHMRRAMLMFARYAPNVEVIPAATDHEALMRCGWKTGWTWRDLIPDSESFSLSSYMFHELVGYWGYRLLRK